MLKFIWERFHQKYPSISKSAFNKLYKQYEAIKPFKSCENIFESGQNINDLIHYILRLATQYHLTEAFKAMKVDLNDPNVAEIADLDNIGTPGRIAKIWVGSSTDDDCELGGGRFSKPIRLAKFPNVYGSRIIEKSFETAIDDYSHEVFGSIVILMIRKILTKPNFSGYTWTEDFISDSCYRVFKYLHNFEPSKISKISGQSVNAFAYVSQIIHNSIVAIIKQKQKEQKDIDSFVAETESNTGPFVGDLKYDNPEINPKIIKIETESDFFDIDLNSVENKHIILEYSNFKISYDLYARIYAYLKKYADKNISIVKSKSKTK